MSARTTGSLAPLWYTLLLLPLASGCPTDGLDDDDGDPMEGLEVEDLGDFTVLDSYEDDGWLAVTVPDGALSTTVVMEGAQDELLTQYTVKDPDGVVIYSFDDEYGYNTRCFPTDDVHTFQHPTSPDEPLRAGTYTMEPFATATPLDVAVTVIHRMSGESDLSLDVTFHFVGVPGLDAAGAADHAALQECVGELDALLSDSGVVIGDIAYEDVTTDVDALTLIESDEGPGSELGRLLAMSGDALDRRLHLFFVQGIDYGGLEVLGQAGSAPGPAVVQGTSHSGIAVSTIDLESQPALTALVVAHEIGHYLGLFHTTERDGNGWDPLGDTDYCDPSNDTNGDTFLSASECAGLGDDNVMFWSPDPDDPGDVSGYTFSGDQGYVVGRSALPR